MKRIAVLLVGVSFIGMPLCAMPSQITFQGTLKQHSVPVNTTKNMQFSFVDGSGASIPGTMPISVANVQVINGLFAVQLPLDPTVPWEQYSPFIQVSVEGQILNPNQPLNANLYAVATFPQGFIGMFTTSCPAGWSRLAALDNAFPMGGPTYGATGGNATHTHTLGAPSSVANGVVFGSGQGSGSFGSDWSRAAHSHSVTTESNIPPFLTVVYCTKN
jgi:hypothetical protein